MNTETNRPLKWVPSAYFAMGLPFVILNMVCVLMFKGSCACVLSFCFDFYLFLCHYLLQFKSMF